MLSQRYHTQDCFPSPLLSVFDMKMFFLFSLSPPTREYNAKKGKQVGFSHRTARDSNGLYSPTPNLISSISTIQHNRSYSSSNQKRQKGFSLASPYLWKLLPDPLRLSLFLEVSLAVTPFPSISEFWRLGHVLDYKDCRRPSLVLHFPFSSVHHN